jgi:aerobic carbon-monoxide dehydrogenase medium subunit
MRDFVYHRPTSLGDAGRLAAEQGAMLLAGGQTLLRDMKLGKHAPASLVDVFGILSRQIEPRDGAVSIGAGATHEEVAGAPVLRRHLPVLADLVGHIGDPAVRNRGTLGGSLAGNEPAGDYAAACLALGAEVQTTGRAIAAVEFFVGDRRTVLEPGEIVLSATFPLTRGAAYIKFLNPAARYPMVGVFAAVAGDGTPRIAVTGARADGAFRWREAESALIRAFTPDELRGVRLPLEGLVEDLFADAAYRAHLAGVLARRAVALARGPTQRVVVLSHGAPAGADSARA